MADEFNEDGEFEEEEHYTREEALAIARTEALRDLIISDDAIVYVAFLPTIEDYCECEFLRDGTRWFRIEGLLEPSRRLPGEEITDERMIRLARNGKKVYAIMMYRTKHQVGLMEGKVGVEALLAQAEQSAPSNPDGTS